MEKFQHLYLIWTFIVILNVILSLKFIYKIKLSLFPAEFINIYISYDRKVHACQKFTCIISSFILVPNPWFLQGFKKFGEHSASSCQENVRETLGLDVGSDIYCAALNLRFLSLSWQSYFVLQLWRLSTSSVSSICGIKWLANGFKSMLMTEREGGIF